jgi:hypothetical protein
LSQAVAVAVMIQVGMLTAVVVAVRVDTVLATNL